MKRAVLYLFTIVSAATSAHAQCGTDVISGYTTPSSLGCELRVLADSHIQWIGLNYSEHRWRDRSGNAFRYTGRASRIRQNGTVQLLLTVDVFFQVAH